MALGADRSQRIKILGQDERAHGFFRRNAAFLDRKQRGDRVADALGDRDALGGDAFTLQFLALLLGFGGFHGR